MPGGYNGTQNSGVQGHHAIYVGTVNSGRQPVIRGYVGTQNSGVQLMFIGLAASANNCSGGSSKAATVTTTSSTCSTAGGTGNFGFSWSISSDGQGAVTINNPNSQSTTFSGYVNGATGTRVLQATCVVTDNTTGLTASATCSVTLSYSGAVS